jgi:glycosyltransferase involved in cell wall biosynthesis
LKVLILTQYYPPETGAAQNRLHATAQGLIENGIDVEVLTAMPNYPKMKVFDGYRRRCFKRDEIDGIIVRRSWIYVKNSKSIFHRLLNYFSFVFTSICTGLFRTGKYDCILVESPPLFLGISAYLLSRFKRAKLIFNVSDLWPESAEKLGLIKSRLLLGLSKRLEEFMYRKSSLITGQTRGIVNNIHTRFPEKNIHWFPNGADLDFYLPEKYDMQKWRTKAGFSADDFIVFYGGILGHAQGLEVILYAALKLKDHKRIKFIILGNGPRRDILIKMKEEMRIDNVQFFDAIPKTDMPDVIASIDLSVIPLKKLELFKGAIPSKIFESLAMKKPVLLGVEGEAKTLFIDEGKGGLAYTPEDHDDLAEKVLHLSANNEKVQELGVAGKDYVNKKFDRKKIIKEFAGILEQSIKKK